MTTRALIPVDKETFEALQRRVTLLEQRAATSESEDEDDGCPHDDPDCTGNNGDCHDACERPGTAAARNGVAEEIYRLAECLDEEGEIGMAAVALKAREEIVRLTQALTAAQAEVARMREALEPFADAHDAAVKELQGENVENGELIDRATYDLLWGHFVAARAALGRVADFQEQDERGQLTHLNHISLMPDELQALAELRKLGLASIDVQDDEDGEAAHDAFREALWDYCDDTLYRLLMCVVPHDGVPAHE